MQLIPDFQQFKAPQTALYRHDSRPSGSRGKVSLLVWNLSTNDGAIRALLLSEALKRLDFQVEIVGFRFGDSLYSAIPDSIPICAIAGTQYPQFFRSIAQLLPQIQGDILYAVKPQPGSFGVALLKRWLSRSRKPLILDIDDWELSWHGGDDFRYDWRARRVLRDLLKSQGALRRPDHPLYLQWMERLIDRADDVTTHTSFLQQRFGGVSVPNGKDVDLFDPQPYDPEACRAKYGLLDYRVLMFPGAPRPYKGLEDILTALDLLNQPDLRLAIVGGNPYDDYDEQLKRQWGRWLIQLPRQSADRMPELIAAAHAIVIPQRDTAATRAQFPLKITDGMAMAKPILSTRVGDIPHILGDTGYLVDANSPEQLAAQINSIFANPAEAIDRGQRARQRCIEHYSLDAMSRQIAPVLENCLRLRCR
ncbi:glycosyltransferase family 4 protein [Leptolyngbya ohadii]|uniref:glycosyltransferase family 4 protein n=1 Tax=Leptolyngbya ohadii TaxID=1962290 RepID=UPI000B59E052|nr:glycosyltransferase family 4 protein [Leptolyngbya ohadii]